MSLSHELLKRFESPLVWGSSDCAHFAAAAAEFYGGREVPLPPYSTQREALEVVARAGGFVELLTATLGEPVPVVHARTGDVVLTAFADSGQMLGVADPPWFWVLVAQGGFMPLSLELAVEVWPCRQR